MTEESSTLSHLSVAMTTKENDETQTAAGKSWAVDEFYLQLVVVVIGVVGTAGNALILYALVASKQHKKHLLIVNQNALDLFSSFNLIVSFAVKLCNVQFQFVGSLGYWLCMIFISEFFVWLGLTASVVNLAVVTIDRYLKVVHHVWSKKRLRPWVIKSAMAFAWFAGIVSNTPTLFETSGVVNGMCYTWVLYKSYEARVASQIWYVVSFYIIILVIFVYCYGSILIVIRRQARVMASYNADGSNTSQNQLNQMQINVIKTKILVSAFYAVAWLPQSIYFVFITMDPNLSYLDSYFYAATFAAFLYISANPFIYATKFNPVKQILTDMIPCKKTFVQPTEEVPMAPIGVRTAAPGRY